MKYKFTLIDTGGQITAIVCDNVRKEKYPKIARDLMNADKTIEQVGFIEGDKLQPRFQMMGGELSINGTLAAAYFISQKYNISSFELKTSGLNEPVRVDTVENEVYALFPKSIVISSTNKKVIFDGMSYIMKNENQTMSETSRWETILKKETVSNPASGVIFYNENKISPLIYVKATNTLVWENACGSGSLAFYLLSGVKNIIQPSKQIIYINDEGEFYSVATTAKFID